jgi:CxxC motif-containing protein (DUF1111 family)
MPMPLARSWKYRPLARPARPSLLLAAALLISSAALFVVAQRGAAGGERGDALFTTRFSPAQGLGPLFNRQSCQDCHNTPTLGGSAPDGLGTVLRVGRLANDSYDPLLGTGGPVARAHAVAELGTACALQAGVPVGANLTSVRNAPPLFGAGLIDAIPDEVILAQNGRANLIDGRVGRFGWKADTASLRQFVGDAFRNELGLTNPVAPVDLVSGCGAERIDLDAESVDAVTKFIAELRAPVSQPADAGMFNSVGCARCHTPNLGGVPLYSDLLIHDVGRALDDGITQGQARGQDWRTTPLWGLRDRTRFLHDGRARTVEAAILAHSGEAEPVIERFRAASAADKAALLAFLAAL